MSDLNSNLSLSHIQVSSDNNYLLELKLVHAKSPSTEPKTLNPAISKRLLDKSVPYKSGSGMAPQKTPFLSAHFSVIAHATEDVQKVEQAASFLIELVSKGQANLTRQYMKGHHGNLIATISAKLTGKELFPNALEVLSQRVSESDRQFLSSDIKDCVDKEGNLYLRFDKQEACLRKVKLHQGDPIRMKLKFVSGHDPVRIIDLCRESGLAP
jgi:RNA binding exosome subunit